MIYTVCSFGTIPWRMRYLCQFILQIHIFLSCSACNKIIHVFFTKKFVSVKNIRIFVAYVILMIIFKLKTMTMWKAFYICRFRNW